MQRDVSTCERSNFPSVIASTHLFCCATFRVCRAIDRRLCRTEKWKISSSWHYYTFYFLNSVVHIFLKCGIQPRGLTFGDFLLTQYPRIEPTLQQYFAEKLCCCNASILRVHKTRLSQFLVLFLPLRVKKHYVHLLCTYSSCL